MREIKFRGRRKDNGEWVYGCLHVIDTKGYGYTGKAIQIQHGTSRPWSVTIDPATIGQFTEKHDHNGDEIYEDDNVKWTSLNVEGEHVGEVTFFEGCWFIQGNTANGCLNDCLTVEVIGNIHEGGGPHE